jgi:hypothetical protein
MAGGRPPSFNSFTCPNCQTLYHVVKVEGGPQTDSREITRRTCGGPLTAREPPWHVGQIREFTAARRASERQHASSEAPTGRPSNRR